MYIYLAHSYLPTCKECKTHVYDIKTGVPLRRGGQIAKRPRGDMSTPCHECPKLSREDRLNDPRPERAVEPTDRVKQSYFYYRHCEVDRTGRLPIDDLVLETNAICRMAEEDARAAQQTIALIPFISSGGE